MDNAETEFKKPTLVGKIGKLPRKLNAEVKKQIDILKNNEEEKVQTTNDISSENRPDEYISEESKILNLNNDSEDVGNPYKEPSWSSSPNSHDEKFNLEVIKSGVILETIDLNSKAYFTFGRLPDCDIVMAHPTSSRYHAVLQFNPTQKENRVKGWYIFDQNSTHGTFLNKIKILPLRYVLVKPGFVLKFGGSTRNYILVSETDDYEETEMTITDVINKRKENDEALFRQKEKLQKVTELKENEGIDWGMGEDADQESDLTENPYAITNNEELFLDDPKKTLRGFFEREGLDLVYDVEDKGSAHFVCRIKLPIDDSNGKPVVAQYSHHGKKKEVVVQCALEACRILDRYGLLRQSQHEPRKRKTQNSDSDEDDFLDRTGDVERKRLKKSLKQVRKPASHQDLLNEEKELLNKIKELQIKLDRSNQNKINTEDQNSDKDDLDCFMLGLQNEKMDNITKRKIMVEIKHLQDKIKDVQRLIKLTEPNKLPDLKMCEVTIEKNKAKNTEKKNLLPLYGKRPCFKKSLEIKKPSLETLKPGSEIDEVTEMENDNKLPTNENNASSKWNSDNVISQKNTKEKFEKEFKHSTIETNSTTRESIKVVTENSAIKEISDSEIKLDKHKIRRNRFRKRTKDERSEDNSEEIDQLGDKYNTWVPPVDQIGDGKTKLNDKFGY